MEWGVWQGGNDIEWFVIWGSWSKCNIEKYVLIIWKEIKGGKSKNKPGKAYIYGRD